MSALDDPGRSASEGHGPRAVAVTVDLPTLLGLAEHPGELAGYGPIPASMARSLAADRNWRRLVTDPVSGALLGYGRRTYAPPAALAEFVIVRDRNCRCPGCQVPASRCDLDHVRAFRAGARSGRQRHLDEPGRRDLHAAGTADRAGRLAATLFAADGDAATFTDRAVDRHLVTPALPIRASLTEGAMLTW